MATVTCHTADCPNEDIRIEFPHPVDEDTGQPRDPWNIVCGVCGNPITDIVEER